MVFLGFWQGLSKEESLDLGFEPRQSGDSSQMASSELQADGATKTERSLTKRFHITFWNWPRTGWMGEKHQVTYVLEFSKSSRFRIGGRVKSDMCRAKLKGKRGLCCWTDVTQKLISCTRGGILQAANAVRLTEVILVEVLLYVHKNRWFIRDGSPGRPPRFSHISWALCGNTLLPNL